MKQSAGERTRERILKAGVELWPDVTLQAVADKVGLTHPAILHHFPQNTLKDAVAEHAVETGDSNVIVQLFASTHPATAKMTESELAAHFKSL